MPPAQVRSITIHIRVTPAEHDAILAASEHAERPLGRYLVECEAQIRKPQPGRPKGKREAAP